MNSTVFFRQLFVLLCLLPPVARSAQQERRSRPLISPIFADHMVLQRDRPNTFWGWAKPHETVRLSLDTQAASTRTGADGRWEMRLTPPTASATPVRLVIETDSQRIELSDLLVGDVWLCSGQSNMNFPLADAQNGPAEIAAADHRSIRFFKALQRPRYTSTLLPEGTWQICSPENAETAGLSAVAYFFARKIQAETGVPIGIVQVAVGGTPIEAWMSADALRPFPEFREHLVELERLRSTGAPEYGNFVMHWYDRYDIGSRGLTWAQPDLDDSSWKQVAVPGAFTALGLAEVPAVVWLRREVILPDPLPSGPVKLHLGSVEKMDTAYLNGQWIGASAWVENPRIYTAPSSALKPGKNLLALRVFKVKSHEAFLSPPQTLQMELGDGTTIPLASDTWKAAVSVNARPPHPLPLGFENWPVMPTVLHCGMIEPLAPLAIRGALWYQGEANADRACQYRSLLPAMIADWRHLFRQGDFPFYIVSLPAFLQRRAEPGDEDWAELREAQALTTRSVPNTGLAVIIDSGDANDIHPKDKKLVGDRLALLALADLYGKQIPSRGPEFTRADFLPDGKVRLHFNHADGGLVVHGDKLTGFAIAGADRKWIWADAVLDDETVIVFSSQVPHPAAVRYAWQSNPAVSLFNGAGLPAAPFRTDDWPSSSSTSNFRSP